MAHVLVVWHVGSEVHRIGQQFGGRAAWTGDQLGGLTRGITINVQQRLQPGAARIANNPVGESYVKTDR